MRTPDAGIGHHVESHAPSNDVITSRRLNTPRGARHASSPKQETGLQPRVPSHEATALAVTALANKCMRAIQRGFRRSLAGALGRRERKCVHLLSRADVFAQGWRESAQLLAWIGQEAERHVRSELLVKHVPQLHDFQRVEAQLVQGLPLDFLPTAAVLRVRDEEALHELLRRGRITRRNLLHRLRRSAVGHEVQNGEVPPLRLLPLHVAGAELHGGGLRL
eukprot:CAMPEP_0176282366 /NCGR_PEP_ID=MMETSP0121_2-20121125/50770_1 /TAXON_ID=160619 /ORGANISM="Kryptoperidinium foliaceum, Strain CCMP 1326" /LENGTH=220 /DNA_ID=CAMNT_0017622723 /DNA_START=410 /DNA_END=1070 /DNA_ORIENTATION=-